MHPESRDLSKIFLEGSSSHTLDFSHTSYRTILADSVIIGKGYCHVAEIRVLTFPNIPS